MTERDSIIARHRSARPDPVANPAWANSEHDMGRLIEIDDARIADLERDLALANDGAAKGELARQTAAGMEMMIAELAREVKALRTSYGL